MSIVVAGFGIMGLHLPMREGDVGSSPTTARLGFDDEEIYWMLSSSSLGVFV